MAARQKLPRDVSGNECISALGRLGYEPVRRRSGTSHVRLKCDGRKPVTVPLHDQLGPRLLRRIVRETGLTVDRFLELLDRG